jgi:hypothetical protein
MSDRMDRKRVILVSQAVMMVCSIMMGICIHTSIPDLAFQCSRARFPGGAGAAVTRLSTGV